MVCGAGVWMKLPAWFSWATSSMSPVGAGGLGVLAAADSVGNVEKSFGIFQKEIPIFFCFLRGGVDFFPFSLREFFF